MTRRAEFPASVKREAIDRSQGICECHLIPHVFNQPCGCRLGPGNTFFEHIDPDGLRKDNSLRNCAALTKTCWRFKTDHFDRPRVAKAQRNFDSHNGIRRPRKSLPGSRNDAFYFTPGSTVPLDRRTGLPWRGGQ